MADGSGKAMVTRLLSPAQSLTDSTGPRVQKYLTLAMSKGSFILSWLSPEGRTQGHGGPTPHLIQDVNCNDNPTEPWISDIYIMIHISYKIIVME